MFRPVDRHGRVHDPRLSGEAVSLVVRERAAAAGFDPARSGHSLRAGLVTSAAKLVSRLGGSGPRPVLPVTRC